MKVWIDHDLCTRHGLFSEVEAAEGCPGEWTFIGVDD